ncbi:dipeptide/oligopeptide/nickel ABC transporter permease/ATP-binding protein [Corynebacterium sp. CCM 9185]|uniref:Dipeptide/oligopeptide/nickel ABC transporter permease/ATP-binding protein n=1 Tax=Corynebacterium marambiense TaxID=2765364 RepID=A0ABS0VSG8_9CORY|nr:dipeptide/oligopeptide/nickel ABC transporter permease/ATP-binding protein [Corynebacterium marambiense]MBI8999687.1 dipeptide/oligopeptide/nickel ABC transporter permease/ATP-binding protein [Corynebacterium marambiense]MCK7662527.1 dipeptide/oligopeptide/nickel ABC transporter permease/ATP-binding protein [Corynebacterium marambiense]MCX7541815.1 dipeptide/oligopeptide/nickel ABC transporter permease/ATP-binding protein [Corynebacterium marambiense]
MRRELTTKLSKPGLRFGRWRAMSVPSRISVILLAAIIIIAVFAPVFATHDPLLITRPNAAPDSEYWFGTDYLGRDVYSRMVYGARISLTIGICATLFALACAAVLGSIAAVSSRWVSETLMRVLDIIMSFPGIALAAVFIAVFGNSIPILIFSIGFLYIPQLTRVVRANVLDQWGEDYVNAVVVSGAARTWILIKHVARNCVAPILVFATVLVADAIVFEASLSFINAGVPEPDPSWGSIIASARQGVLTGFWWAAMFPGLAIMITVLALNVLAEGITDALVAAPGATKVDPAGTDGKREADRLASDPVAAYKVQEEDLNKRLAELREVESRRTDRFVPDYSVPPLLEVKDLCLRFPRHGDVDVVDHVSFEVRPGQTMALVGESGCGKSITALTIMGLLDSKATINGEIIYDGTDLLKLSTKQHAALRGHEIAMIYQDALSSLNPSMLIKAQLKQLTKRGGTRSAEELLELVGLDPKRTLESYPHELSGGQRQRVLIAMALTRDPKLIIADEPTTALDVTVQKQVIELLNDLQDKLGFAMIFVSHDLALVAEVAHSITVMYAGQVVEQAPTVELMTDPRHEYTRGLLGSVLSIEAGSGRLHQVPGVVPSPRDFPRGDRFAPRSSHPTVGLDTRPVLTRAGGEHHFYAVQPELAESGK